MITLREKLRPGAFLQSGGARLGLAAAALGALSAGSLFIGVSDIGIADLLRGEPSRMLLFVESRAPRLAAILLSGSVMGVAGLIMQSLARNRFVAPTTAGTVDAAGFGILVATIWFAGASVLVKMTIAVVFALGGTALFFGADPAAALRRHYCRAADRHYAGRGDTGGGYLFGFAV